MTSLSTDVLDMFLPPGTDLLATCMAKQNRVAVLMAGAGIVLLALAYTKIDWIGAGQPTQNTDTKTEEEY